MTYEYSGTLKEGSPTYVKRKADEELHAELKAGQICYVFSYSKAGKSSLQIKEQSSLKKEEFDCSTIDIQGIGTNLTLKEWYNTIIEKIAKDLNLKDDLSNWKKENKENNELSALYRFRDFIESVVLTKKTGKIVIFIDEINHVHKLNFSTDEFFGFIRFCHNERASNPNYERLVFCLLGIASPSDLVKDKQITPFNISKAISLEPFVIDDVEPLQRGLEGKFDDTNAVMKEILYWTGGQPFLTQKLCKLMLDESEKDHPRTVEEVVREKIIKNWKSQDSPAHLQTIYNRIVNSQKASFLLELYRQIIELEEIDSNDSREVTELLLSGIVVKNNDKLKVYNPIYQQIFNHRWIVNQLNNLRPYSENYQAWLDSGKTDKSRLLRGNALQEAEEWKIGKDLSSDEKEYLDASREQKRQEKQAAKDREAELKRERKDKEAAQKRNRRIFFESVVLGVSLLGSVHIGLFVQKQLDKITQEVTSVQQLTEEAGKLQIQDNDGYTEALRLSALFFSIDNPQLKRALLSATASQVKQNLQKVKEAEEEINKSQKILSELSEADKNTFDSSQGLQVQMLFYLSKGSLLVQKKQTQKAIESYQAAYSIWTHHPDESYLNKTNKLVIPENVEFLHLALIELISENNEEKELKKQFVQSLKNYLYTQLEYYLKTQKLLAADETTFKLILTTAIIDKNGYLDKFNRNISLDSDSIKNLSCTDLQKIDNLWVKYSNGHFGYSVQGKIFLETGNKLNQADKLAYTRFGTGVGWYDEKRNRQRNGGGWLNRRHQELNYSIDAPKGHLPGNASFWLWSDTVGLRYGWQFSNRTAACTLR